MIRPLPTAALLLWVAGEGWESLVRQFPHEPVREGDHAVALFEALAQLPCERCERPTTAAVLRAGRLADGLAICHGCRARLR